MNIIVCIKQVPGTNKVEVDPTTGVLKRSGVESKMNPYDLYALETALKLRERAGGTVKVITMGPPQAKEVIREAFSMGADEGYLMTDRKFAGADVLATSYTLAEGIGKKLGEYDVIICGKQTTDGDTAQVGPEIGEWMNIPSIANIVSIDEITDTSITVKMDIPTAIETAKIQFPCIISVEKDIFEPRLPSYIKKKETKDRPITEITAADLVGSDPKNFGLSGSPTQVSRIFPPESNSEHETWTGAPEILAERIAEKITELKLM